MSLVGLNGRGGYGQSRPSAVGVLFLWEKMPSLREGASSRCFTKITSTFSQKVKNAISKANLQWGDIWKTNFG